MIRPPAHPLTGIAILVASLIASAITNNMDYFGVGYPLAIAASYIFPSKERWL